MGTGYEAEDELPPLDGTGDTREVMPLRAVKEDMWLAAVEDEDEYTPEGASSVLLQQTLEVEEAASSLAVETAVDDEDLEENLDEDLQEAEDE
ncbi:hypothetical protein [Borrelia sp. P9F1]|uniref:hypothetical protein n=1 Tax=Borrelia sp. P9F1 TaxID=3058374 RepID=UPI002649ACDA|nr:hypothetical protein [Borrelia sp. P9F1]WKC58525.1 hypothetical protein QYZ68_04720 [Borrelia sp. P9F1]